MEVEGGKTAGGDPQVFYFGVFDGHGGSECSDFLREGLHGYVERAAGGMGVRSSLQTAQDQRKIGEREGAVAIEMERSLVAQWKEMVGGYFRRFKPEYFTTSNEADTNTGAEGEGKVSGEISIETALMYAFLKADLDFITTQASKPDPSTQQNSDHPLNAHDILGSPSHLSSSPPARTRFLGGSTASIALISTPTPTPFWHPASPSTLLVAHVGDTRILLCSTATGLPVPLTTNHHPSSPVEQTRLRRYAASFVTDSFGEERMSGLANTRAFGDMRSKRIGVSSEPEITRLHLSPAEYSFLVLISDGVSGTLSDQEIVDVVKEAKTPEQGARDVVGFAEVVGREGDNSTCLVVRLGGWERRGEGGVGSLGTREGREWRRREAEDPRAGRT